MAALSTTVQKIGINGAYVSASGAHVGWSTATTSVTLTVGDLKNVVFAMHNPTTGVVTVTVSSTQTATRFAGKGIGDFSTSLSSSAYAFLGNLESARFKSSANTIVVTASELIACGVICLGSTRSN